MSRIEKTFCRICLNACPLNVTVTDGKVTKVTGDPHGVLHRGYTCIKGRSQPDYLYHPQRVRHSLKRCPDGSFTRISLATAMDEIAEKLDRIRGEWGPQSICAYIGTMLFTSYTSTMPMMNALMDTIGSTMLFNTDTLDKAGKLVAASLHGDWMAPATGFDEPEVALLIGINPVVTFTGAPVGNPGRWFKEQKQRGMELFVIDPRRTQVAKRSDVHLRARPGSDVAILACFVRIILAERLYDESFVEENVSGLEMLRQSVAPFDPQTVARLAGVEVDELVLVARRIARRKRAYIMAGTGPHMSANGTLTEYLILVLQSLCGYWLRAGDRVCAVPSLFAQPGYRAQAKAPDREWAWGRGLGRLGLRETAAGLPITALTDEILSDKPNRVRAMLTVGGNPLAAIPDTGKTSAALESLELHVMVDPWRSRSTELAHYVIAPTMPLEAPATTQGLDLLTRWTGYGLGAAYADYTPAIVEPPADSEVVDDWQFLYGLATRLGFSGWVPRFGGDRFRISDKSSSEALLALMTTDSRIALSTVKSNRGGRLYPSSTVVEARAKGWEQKFDVANPLMMADLEFFARNGPPRGSNDHQFPFRLLCRRHMHVFNSSCNIEATRRGKAYNPAFLSPADMSRLSLVDGDRIVIRSVHGQVRAIAETDPELPAGFVSMMFAYGLSVGSGIDVRDVGTNPNDLLSLTEVYDSYTGQPRMSNVPVEVDKDEAQSSIADQPKTTQLRDAGNSRN